MAATTEQAAAQTAFSADIRAASMSAHRDAQSSAFVRDLLAGKSDLKAYAQLVAQHYFVYRELELAGDAMASDPIAGTFISADLRRTPALEADLAHLLGAEWAHKITPTSETTVYCDRIKEVCLTWPGGFVAHHYVRYMGDLSGGQHIGEIIRRTYNLNGNGAKFYTFDGIADPTAFKDSYREKLDRTAWDADERRRVIAEVLLAYELNTRLLQGLS